MDNALQSPLSGVRVFIVTQGANGLRFFLL